MATSLRHLMHHLRRMVAPAEPVSDAMLLERFTLEKDEEAFAALVARHGPMVLRVCQRVLADPEVAEDCFQAAFLVLARKAPSLRRPESLAGWLHGVALRVAADARKAHRRRPLYQMPARAATLPDPHPDSLAQLTARELLVAVDEEVEHLPEAYRLPLILCCLEGLSQEETARRLGWTAGSVKARLERGRKRLKARLARRGLTLPAALVTLEVARGTAGATVGPGLRAATVKAAVLFGVAGPAGARCGPAFLLAEAALHGMTAGKLKALAWMVVWGAVALTSAGGLVLRDVGEQTKPSAHADGPVANKADPGVGAARFQRAGAVEQPAPDPGPRLDDSGDVLPPGATARMGTVRLRHEGFDFYFSPDGKMLASAGRDASIRLWDTATGKEMQRLTGHKEFAYCVAFSPDGKTLASGDIQYVRLWDLKTGKEIFKVRGFNEGKDFSEPRKFTGTTVGIYALAFAPDGKTLAAGEGDVRITLWDTATGKTIRQLEKVGAVFKRLLFLPDRRTLVSSSSESSVIWDTATGKEIAALPTGDKYTPRHTASSTDGKIIAVGAERFIVRGQTAIRTEGTLHLWDGSKRKELHRMEVPTQITGVAVSPHGRTLAYTQRLSGNLSFPKL